MPHDVAPVYLGIDPGRQGAAAALHGNGRIAWVCTFDRDSEQQLLSYLEQQPVELACIEKVHAMPHQGVCSMFSFGQAFGQVIGIVKALRISHMLVAPQSWKRTILRDTDRRNKDAAIAYCQRRWPDAHVHLIPPKARKPHTGVADALCLAEYGWRTLGARRDP